MKTQLLKFTAFLLIFAGVATSCNPETPKPPEPNYPINIPFTEYSLLDTDCQWTNLPYDEKVIVINSSEELEKYISCTGGAYPDIDFSESTLLITSGVSTNNIPEITLTNLQQLSFNKFCLDIEIAINAVVEEEKWAKALVIEKIRETSKVELNITLDMRIDFSNIENLYEQPLPVIQRCIEGKWKLIDLQMLIFPRFTPSDTYVNIDIDNNRVQVIVGENEHLQPDRIMDGFLQTPSLYVWKKKEIYSYRDLSAYLWDAYVMNFENERKFLIYHYESRKVGWYFDRISCGSLFGICVLLENLNSTEVGFHREIFTLERITEQP